ALSHDAATAAQSEGQQERAALYRTSVAMWNALAGNAAAARAAVAQNLAASQGRETVYGAALTLAMTGDFARAQSLADDLERRFPEDTSVQFNYLPSLRALSALNRGEPAKAVELLQANVPYELAPPAIQFYGFYGGMRPTYIRGLAYRALG